MEKDQVHPTPDTTEGRVERIYPIRLIIAGSRGDYEVKFFKDTVVSVIKDLVKEHGGSRNDLEIVSGMADSGADYYAVIFADRYKLPLKGFWANWNDTQVKDARVKTSVRGKEYNANAGHDRNTQMAKYATHLLAFWDGRSPGTRHMIETANAHGVSVLEVRIDTPKPSMNRRESSKNASQSR